MTRVEFKIVLNDNDKKEKGEVLAVFIDEDWDTSSVSFPCYSHNGQHSACEKKWADGLFYARYNEYKALLNELVNLGYDDLVVVNPDFKK